jgi:hypothetical protein
VTDPTPVSADAFIQQRLCDGILELEDHFQAAVLSMSGPIVDGVDGILRNAVEGRRSAQPSYRKLVVMLTTLGGYIEVVHRIVDTFRHHYDLVDFVVPDHAYSAGTVLVLSGDAIHMDYYSRLGPIDPQVESKEGRPVPALGYLERYNELIQKATDGRIMAAEVQLLISGFDQGELYHYEQARELSIALLKEWLVKYKFKNWDLTETRKIPVTPEMRTDSAERIARELSNTRKWHVHGYGISREVLERDLNLRIDDFGNLPPRGRLIRGYHALLTDYMVKLGKQGVIHTHAGFVPFM